MLRLFANRIKFVFNLVALYAYNFYESITKQRHLQESVVLFDNIHTTDTHTIVDFTVFKDNTHTRSIILENPKLETKNHFLSVYDIGLSRDLTSQFKRFSHHYNKETRSFEFLNVIKKFLGTSEKIVLVDHLLDERELVSRV